MPALLYLEGFARLDAPQKATALDRLIATGRATAAAGDLLEVLPPRNKRVSRRASRALARLREERE